MIDRGSAAEISNKEKAVEDQLASVIQELEAASASLQALVQDVYEHMEASKEKEGQ